MEFGCHIACFLGAVASRRRVYKIWGTCLGGWVVERKGVRNAQCIGLGARSGLGNASESGRVAGSAGHVWMWVHASRHARICLRPAGGPCRAFGNPAGRRVVRVSCSKACIHMSNANMYRGWPRGCICCRLTYVWVVARFRSRDLAGGDVIIRSLRCPTARPEIVCAPPRSSSRSRV